MNPFKIHIAKQNILMMLDNRKSYTKNGDLVYVLSPDDIDLIFTGFMDIVESSKP